jgi:hypothetical protein
VTFKSGVVHDQIAISDKETAAAMMDTLKTNSGLFKASDEKGYVAAENFCKFKPVINGLTSAITKLGRDITGAEAAQILEDDLK